MKPNIELIKPKNTAPFSGGAMPTESCNSHATNCETGILIVLFDGHCIAMSLKKQNND